MALTLRRLLQSEVAQFLFASRDRYLAERIEAGDDPTAATGAADEQMAAMFPDGQPAPGHLLYRLEEDGRPVGWLWLGPGSTARPESCWVWDIFIDQANRGRGLGRAGMLLAESEARSIGATELELNVFGPNAVARHLYEALGYATVAIRMSKKL